MYALSQGMLPPQQQLNQVYGSMLAMVSADQWNSLSYYKCCNREKDSVLPTQARLRQQDLGENVTSESWTQARVYKEGRQNSQY